VSSCHEQDKGAFMSASTTSSWTNKHDGVGLKFHKREGRGKYMKKRNVEKGPTG
jgi:hypothetical protein